MSEELFEKYLSRTLSTQEMTRLNELLKGDEAVKLEFVEFVQEWQLLASAAKKQTEVVSLPKLVEIPPDQARNAFRRPWIPALAAAAAIMLMVGWWWLSGSRSGGVVANVVHIQGSVVIHKMTDKKSRNARMGETIVAGTIIKTGEDGEVKLAYGNGVADVTLKANSKLLTAKSKSEKSLGLENGRLIATVAKQPKDNPFVVTTAHAEMRVLGTKFDVLVDDKLTRLKVSEGVVSMRGSDGDAVAVKAGFVAAAAEGMQIRPVLMDEGKNLPEGVLFFRDFETILPGERSYNELIRLKEPEGEVTALVSNPCGPKSRTVKFLPDVELNYQKVFSKQVKEEPLYIIPENMEIRIRIKAEHPGKIGFGQKPTHVRFKMEHFYGEGFEVDRGWNEVVVRNRDVFPYMAEGPSRDFVSGVGISSFVIYGFGTGKLHLDSVTVVATTKGSSPTVKSDPDDSKDQ
jgi:ferric-dicitrate binding protein FerR (iron transport regulator)